jgi:long-chain acyl-CoA synthetase
MMMDRDPDELLATTHSVDGSDIAQPWTVAAIAARWRALGVCDGHVVVLALPNGVALLRHFLAALAAGAVPALVSANTPGARLTAIAHAFGARAIASIRMPDTVDFGRTGSVAELEVQVVPGDPLPAAYPGELILMTSGTSGVSSGCVFDVSSVVRNAERHAAAIGLGGDDTVLVNLPLHFSYALVAQAVASWRVGAKLVVAGPPFRTAKYADALTRHRVTVSSLTPPLVRQVIADGAGSWRDLRALTVGGDAISVGQLEGLVASMAGREVYVTYGLTQAGPRVATLAAHLAEGRRLASVGLPLAGTEISFSRHEGPGGVRELLVRSDTVMKRRIGRVENGRSDWDAPGTLATGDLFSQDADGFLYYHGRLSEFISVAGEKLSLASIRRMVGELPGVVSSRTVVVPSGDESAFDLVVTATAPQAVVTDSVLRLLRLAERPRRIEIVPLGDDAGYK